jgi:lysophospholipase L1-like esterase
LQTDSAEKDLTANDLIFAATQLVTRAHLHGIKVMGGTIMPTGPKNSPDNARRAKARQLVDGYNDWVRTSSTFDSVADFNKVTADPADPYTLLPGLDSGDHVHPNDAGYKAMADAIDLNFFQ